MKRPNITPGDWQTANDFPGCVISGQVEQSPRGKSAMVVCKVQGSCLPTYKANLAAIAAVPELLAALEEAQEFIQTARQYFPKSIKNADRFKLELTSASVSKALTKAGYEFP